MSSEIIMFASVPKPSTLCYTRAKLQSQEQDTTFHSDDQWQIMKCRLLIFAEQEIIASPVFGCLNQLHIITTRDFYNKGKLQELLSMNNLERSEPKPVYSEMYESCLRYTMLARLSPSWNFVEPYLIQGKDFLTDTRIMNAVRVQIIVNGDNAHIVIWPHRIKLVQFQLTDYAKTKKNLSEDQDDFKYDFTVDNEKIFALPRMKLCRIETISHKPPLIYDNVCYDDFKRFWRNKYGYYLPESDEDIYYVTVRFGLNLREMVYPNLCVRQNNLILLPPANYQSTLESFSSDLNEKLSNICTTSQMGYAVSKLNSSTEIFMYPNWSPTKPIRNTQDDSAAKNLAEKPLEDEKRSIAENDPELPTSNQKPVVRGLHFTDIKKRVIKKPNTSLNTKDVNANAKIKEAIVPLKIKEVNTPLKGKEIDTPSIKIKEVKTPLIETKKFKPTFKIKEINPTVKVNEVNTPNIETKKVKPIFKVKEVNPTVKAKEINTSITETKKVKPTFKIKEVNANLKIKKDNPTAKVKDFNTPTVKIKEVNTPIQIKEVNNNNPVKVVDQSSIRKFAKTQTPITTEKVKPLINVDNVESNTAEITVRTLDDKTQGAQSCEPSTEEVTASRRSPKLIINQQISLIPTSLNTSAGSLFAHSLPTEFLAPITISENQVGIKRMGESIPSMPMVAKKPRSRPSVQEDIDVQDYAKRGLLGQANVATLLNFLRKNSVPCRAKDKKSELIIKILAFLNLATENQQNSN